MTVSGFKSFLFLALIFFDLSAIGATESLCSLGRDVIFTCLLDDGKGGVVSLCKGSAPLTVDYLQGTDKGIESKTVFRRDEPIFRWVDAATYTTYFGFKRAGSSYVFGDPQETFGAKAFLELSKSGGQVETVRCHDKSFGDKEFDSPAISDVPDEVVRGSGFEFPP
ncbi:hypothetical protein I5O09_21640 [Pseudomonas parafulva]|uniref:hypothetical protein n=1 Tax=Pseudomonas parafulva TaxID=157782 RepID=UPI00128FACA4|nr:hypothetical protein [Pseudomonas parafulva]MBH3346332.1 hypothetical protein [Pseudomonas parafulva]